MANIDYSDLLASSNSTEVPPSTLRKTPTTINSTKTKSKCSIRHLLSDFKAKFCVSKPNSLENHHQEVASSIAPTHKNDHHSGAISLSSKVICNDLLLVDSAFSEAKKYMDHLNVKIKRANEKFEELETLGNSQRDFDELRKAIARLMFQIPSQLKMHYANSNPRRNQWPNKNKAEDGMTHFFHKEPQVEHNGYVGGQFKAFYDLPEPLRCCLLCFFKFPPEALVKRITLIYLWIGQGYTFWHLQGREDKEELPREEDVGNEIFDELIEEGFIEPINPNCSLVPDNCRMSLSVHSSLYKDAIVHGFTSQNSLDLDLEFDCVSHLGGHSCLVNVGESIINCGPEIFENMKDTQSLHLGR